MATIQGIYLALFGRPADPLGLEYFNSVTNNGADLSAIGPLQSSTEFTTRFAGQSNVQIINAIYQALFNRDADLPGLKFFSDALTSGTLSIANIAIAIYDGAQGADATIRDVKEAAANAFTTALDTPAEIQGYQGPAAAALGAAFIAGVSSTLPTAAQVNAAVSTAAGQMTSTGPTSNEPAEVPLTLNLTTASGERMSGAGGNDTINAILDAVRPTERPGTLNPGDIIDGRDGIDTMNISVITTGTLPAGVAISNVEIINIDQTTATMRSLDSSSFSGVQQLWQIDTTADGFYENVVVGAGVTAGFRGAGGLLNVTVTQSAGDKATVAVDGVASGSIVAIDEGTAGTLKTIALTGGIAASGGVADITVNSSATSIGMLNIALSSSGTFIFNPNAAGATNQLKVVSFAGSTGNITFDASATALRTNALDSVDGGLGNDTITFSNAANDSATATIKLDAGNDTLTFNNTRSATAGATNITLGSGADTVTIVGGGNLVAAGSVAALTASLTTITDFKPSEDTLSITAFGLGGRGDQTAVNAAVAGATDLQAAVTAASTAAGAGKYALFQFGTDTYYFAEGNATVGAQAGDTLIKLAGVQVGALSPTVLSVTQMLTTASGERIVGTDANETIIATTDAASPVSGSGTLNDGDSVDGGGSTDTMNIRVTTGGPLPAGVSISNVEIINVDQTTAALTGLNSSSFAGVQQLWQIDTAAGGSTYSNVTVGAGVTAGFRGAGDQFSATVTQAAGDSAVIAIDGVTSGGVITVGEGTAGTLKTITLTGSVAGGLGFLSLVSTATAVETVNIGLTSSAQITYREPGTQLKTMNFASSTGGINFVAGLGNEGLSSITGGSANDVITFVNFHNVSATATVDLGAGDDLLFLSNGAGSNASATTITLGAGNDKVNIFFRGNLFEADSVADLTASLTTITDFEPNKDVIDIGSFNLTRASQTDVDSAVAAVAAIGDLRSVAEAAADMTAQGQFALFKWLTDTYIYFDFNSVPDVAAGDGLVKLTGVSVTELTNVNFNTVPPPV